MRQARKEKDNPQPFAELHAALVPPIRRYVISLDGQLSQADCDDLIQETVVAFFQGLSDYREEASVVTFALGIAKNLALKNMAKRQRSPMVYAGDLSGILGERELYKQSPSLSIESSEGQEEIQQAMDQLTDIQRQAIELKLSHGSGIAAAKEAGCTPSQLADRLYYAKKRLRQFLNGMLHCILLFAFGTLLGF